MSCECCCIDIKVVLEDETIDVPFEFGEPVDRLVKPDAYTGPVAITPMDEQQTLQTADKMMTDNVIIEPIPGKYIVPTGTEVIAVTENGTVSKDVTNKETVTVNTNVPIPPGYIIPTGNLGITDNGSYDITEKASVTVDVPTFVELTQTEYDALPAKNPVTLYVIMEE